MNGSNVTVPQDKTHVMDGTFLSRLGSEAFELSGMYPAPSAEEVSRMVNEGEVAIDEILGFRESPVTPSAPVATNEVANQAVEQRAEVVAPTPVTSVTEAVEVAVAEAVEVAVPEVVVNTTPTTAVETTTTVENTEAPASAGLSDDDFLKKIGAI